MMTAKDGPTWVYTMLCEHGRELYVGIASDIDRRIYQHSQDKPWWPNVWGVMASQFPTRAEARAREVQRIVGLRPRYNIGDKPRQSPIDIDVWNSYRRYEIVDGTPILLPPMWSE